MSDEIKPTNVTNLMCHHAILSIMDTYTTYAAFLKTDPVVEMYNDEKCKVSVLHTKEVWRKIWLTMIVICYDVRIYGLILHPDTFKSINMVINSNGELKFRKLKAYVNKPAGAPDLVAVATQIQDSFGVGAVVLKEVDVLIKALKQPVGTRKCPVKKTKPFIRCNYALMDNLMRKEFLIWLWHNFNDSEEGIFRSKLSYYCSNNRSWRKDVCRVEGSSIHSVFKYRNPGSTTSLYPGTRSIELSKFIRHALVHLSDAKHGYSPDETVYVLQGYFGDFIPEIQNNLYQNEALLTADLFLFEPVEH